MAFEAANYLVTRDIALRSGFISTRHRTKDGHFILNDRDLSCVRFTVDEYVSGVKKISKAEAKKLIRENNYAIGDTMEETETVATESGENTETANDETVETESETSETEQEEEE